MKYKTIKFKMEEFDYPLNEAMRSNFRIIEADSSESMVCNFPCALGVQSNALLNRQRKYATLLAAAPELLAACKEALRFVSPEEEAFDILHEAIGKATNY